MLEPKSAKAARSYVPISWEKERWDIGLPEELDRMMARRGVGIYPMVELGATEVPFYKWASGEGLCRCVRGSETSLFMQNDPTGSTHRERGPPGQKGQQEGQTACAGRGAAARRMAVVAERPIISWHGLGSPEVARGV